MKALLISSINLVSSLRPRQQEHNRAEQRSDLINAVIKRHSGFRIGFVAVSLSLSLLPLAMPSAPSFPDL